MTLLRPVALGSRAEEKVYVSPFKTGEGDDTGAIPNPGAEKVFARMPVPL